MTSFRALIDPGGRWLAGSLDRLRHTLDTLSGRLKDAVSTAVGETVAGVVGQVVRAALTDVTAPATAYFGRDFPPTHAPRPSWGGPPDFDDEPWFDDRYDPDAEDGYDDEPPLPAAALTPTAARSPRWAGALAVGVRTTLGWLRRAGRPSVLVAVGAGLLTALASYAGGPLAATAIALAGSALGLLSLAEVVQTGADALAVYRP